MKLTKIEPKFIEKHNPRIGLITLASDFRIEKDFNNLIYGKDIDLFCNRIKSYNPLTNETLKKMADDIPKVVKNILPDQKIDCIAYGCTSGSVAIADVGSTLDNALNLTGTNNWIGNDTSTLSADVTSGTLSRGNSYIAGATGNTLSLTVGTTTSGTITLPAATYDTNADVATALTTAINGDATLSAASETVSVIWTGASYAITSSTGAISAVTIDSELDSHAKLSANYGAGAASAGASTGYGGIFSNFKSSLSAGDLNDVGLHATEDTYSAASMGNTTTDWVNEKKPPVKIAYDVENQKFTFEGDGSIIGPSQSSKFFSFSVFGPSTTTNSLGLKSSANAPTSLVGGGEKLGGDAVIFKGTNVSTNQAYGVTVSYNSNLNKFTINSATTGEKILADGAVGVTETTTASNIEVGRLAITAGVATANEAGIGGSNALFGLGSTTAVSTTASGTARGLASKPAILNGKTSNEDLSKEFFLSGASQENVFLVESNNGHSVVDLRSHTTSDSNVYFREQTTPKYLLGKTGANDFQFYDYDKSNRVFVVRADVDLGQLEASATAPAANPVAGTYWFDTVNSKYGVFEWNGSAATVTGGQSFTNKIPTVITSTTQLSSGLGSAPKTSVGSIGDYAITATDTNNDMWYKQYDGSWVAVGTANWVASKPTIAGGTPGTITGGQNFTITINSAATTITASGTTVTDIASDISGAGVSGLSARVNGV